MTTATTPATQTAFGQLLANIHQGSCYSIRIRGTVTFTVRTKESLPHNPTAAATSPPSTKAQSEPKQTIPRALEAPWASGDTVLDILMWIRNGDCIVTQFKERTLFWHRCPETSASSNVKEQLEKTRVIFIKIKHETDHPDKLLYQANLAFWKIQCHCKELQQAISRSPTSLPHAYSLKHDQPLLNPKKV